jgi:hypothetical protein
MENFDELIKLNDCARNLNALINFIHAAELKRETMCNSLLESFHFVDRSDLAAILNKRISVSEFTDIHLKKW